MSSRVKGILLLILALGGVVFAFYTGGVRQGLGSVSLVIGVLQLWAASWIKEEESTHPAYKFEKTVWGAVYAGLGLLAFLKLEPIRDLFRSFIYILLIGSSVIAFLFIRYRKDNPLYHVIRLRTARGVEVSGNLQENNETLSRAAALLRHHRVSGGQPLVSDWAIAEVDHAMKIKGVRDWTDGMLEQARERRRILLEQEEEGGSN